MAGVRHTPLTEENTQEDARRHAEPQSPVAPPPLGPLGRRRLSARRQRDAWFMLLVLALGVVTVFALSSVSAAMQAHPAQTARTAPRPASASRPAVTASTPAPVRDSGNVSVQPAPEKDYMAPQLANAALMQATVDAHGNVWTGEMFKNALARFDPATQTVTTWTPPHGENNIMATAIDTQGNVWFTEQAANYIGRFDPTTQTFKTYPLAPVNGHPAGPQDLQIDAAGHIWFTELETGQIGELDPVTGDIHTWALPSPAGNVQALPYCLAVLPDGRIWVGYLAGGAVGEFDPATGQTVVHRLADPQTQIFAMAGDRHGHVWFTELDEARIGVVDVATGTVREIAVPSAVGSAPNLYALAVGTNGDVWFASSGENAILRYTPSSGHFTVYQLATPQSIPYGLAFDGQGRLWFTADGSPANYIGMLAP